jgi:hypothetical protein
MMNVLSSKNSPRAQDIEGDRPSTIQTFAGRSEMKTEFDG